MSFKTEQEAFWAGDFGNAYIERNQGDEILSSKVSLFSKILGSTNGVSDILELGCNIGLNLKAIHRLLPNSKLSGVEINKTAASEALKIKGVKQIFNVSALDFKTENETWDLAFTYGFLIHINPNELENIYEKLYSSSRKYIMVCEYYNPSPVEVIYRGHAEKLFKRNFAGEILDRYPDLQLVNYGFIWHRDSNFPQDDFNWFLMRKTD